MIMRTRDVGKRRMEKKIQIAPRSLWHVLILDSAWKNNIERSWRMEIDGGSSRAKSYEKKKLPYDKWVTTVPASFHVIKNSDFFTL